MELIILRRNAVLVVNQRPIASDDPNDIWVEKVDVDSKDLANLRRDPTFVEGARPMPVQLIQPVPTSADEHRDLTANSWGIAAVGADKCHNLTGAGVTVAILDTGINQRHPAFKGITFEPKPENFTGEADDEDIDGHGSHCAGTIFGRDVDGRRIGVARGVERALIGKVLGKGAGTTDAVYRGILWACQNGAQIISMSLGINFPRHREWLKKEYGGDDLLATSAALVDYRQNVRLFDRLSQLTGARENLTGGVIVVAATGNESRGPKYRIAAGPPAAAELFLSVGSLGRSKSGSLKVSDFSNSGARFAAPGEDILSANHVGGLRLASGTSMATPHVAGVAALWAERSMQEGAFQAFRVIREMDKAAMDLSDVITDDDVGAGLIQAPVK